MNDGDWEAVRGGHRHSQGASDAESAASDAGAEPRIGSSLRVLTDVIIGWRVWRLWSVGDPRRQRPIALTLQSTFMDTKWPPGQYAKACCDVKRLHHGIHAFATQAQAVGYMHGVKKPHQYVFGEVSLWGRVVIHEGGYRAQCAYPKRIYVPNEYQGDRDIVNALRQSYGIEVEWTT